MNKLKIVRLKNGEDIMGFVTYTQHDGVYDISHPMILDIDFSSRQSQLMMSYWLPVQLIEENVALIKEDSILCFMDPNDDLCEYYRTTTQRLKDILDAKDIVDQMSDEEVEDVLQEFEDFKNSGSVLH